MAYDVFQTCMLVPGLNRTECASWVQAWGTIAAIAAAVGIAWWQRRADREAFAAVAKAKAEIAGTSILLKLHPISGCFQAIERDLRAQHKKVNPMFDPVVLANLLQQQPYPTENELIALADHDALCARWLVRAGNLARQAELGLRLLQHHDSATRFASVGHVAELLQLAIGQLEKAEAALERLAPVDS